MIDSIALLLVRINVLVAGGLGTMLLLIEVYSA